MCNFKHYNMYMPFTNYGILSALVLAFCLLPRLLYFSIKNVKKLPEQLFKRKYLFLFILMASSGFASIVLSFFFTKTFFYLGIFYSWVLVVGVLMSMYLVFMILFWHNGYEIRYMFEKFGVFAPMMFIEVVILLLTGLGSLNYWLIGSSVVFGVSAIIWNYKAYKLTRPKIENTHSKYETDVF